jgi:hypothetical protein
MYVSVTMNKPEVSSRFVLSFVFVVVILWLLGRKFAMFRVMVILLLGAWVKFIVRCEGGGQL